MSACPRACGPSTPHFKWSTATSSLERDGRPVFRDLRWGVYVVFKAPTAYAASCFKQYGLITDGSGQYAVMYKPFHLIGLELSISILHAVLNGQPTGSTHAWRGDVVAVAKRDLRAGETLDGEGGHTIYGKLVPAARSLETGALPIGLAHGVKLGRDVTTGAIIRAADVLLDDNATPVQIRRRMELLFPPAKIGPGENFVLFGHEQHVEIFGVARPGLCVVLVGLKPSRRAVVLHLNEPDGVGRPPPRNTDDNVRVEPRPARQD